MPSSKKQSSLQSCASPQFSNSLQKAINKEDVFSLELVEGSFDSKLENSYRYTSPPSRSTRSNKKNNIIKAKENANSNQNRNYYILLSESEDEEKTSSKKVPPKG